MALVRFTQTNLADANAFYRLIGTTPIVPSVTDLIWFPIERAHTANGITLEIAQLNPGAMQQVRVSPYAAPDQVPPNTWKIGDVAFVQRTTLGYFMLYGVLPKLAPIVLQVSRSALLEAEALSLSSIESMLREGVPS